MEQVVPEIYRLFQISVQRQSGRVYERNCHGVHLQRWKISYPPSTIPVSRFRAGQFGGRHCLLHAFQGIQYACVAEQVDRHRRQTPQTDRIKLLTMCSVIWTISHFRREKWTRTRSPRWYCSQFTRKPTKCWRVTVSGTRRKIWCWNFQKKRVLRCGWTRTVSGDETVRLESKVFKFLY